MLAQLPVELWPRFVELGIAGAMLGWFALRMEKIISANTAATVLMAKSQMLTLMSLRHLDAGVREQVEGHIKEIDRRFPEPGYPERNPRL